LSAWTMSGPSFTVQAYGPGPILTWSAPDRPREGRALADDEPSLFGKASWTRPGLLMVYAVAVLAFVPFFSWSAVEGVQAGRAVDAGRPCAVDRDGPCLDAVAGTLDGPNPRHRSLNVGWEVDGVGGFEIGPHASDELERWQGHPVAALAFRGDVVIIETPDGRSFESLDVGLRGVLGSGSSALLALGGGVGLLRYARRKRHAYGGWWRVDGPSVEAVDLQIACAVMVPASCGFLLEWGAAWWFAVLVTALLTMAAVAAVVRSRRRAGTAPAPRYARDPA
jgi:hypothetical protein